MEGGRLGSMGCVSVTDFSGLGLPILGISQEATGGPLFIGCLPHQKECFLMHFGKHIFSWKTSHLLLNLYFRTKYHLLLCNRKKPAVFTVLHPPFFPVSVSLSSLHSEWPAEWFHLKKLWMAETNLKWHVLSSGSPASHCGQRKRQLVSFKWRQQYFRLSDQGRFYTVGIVGSRYRLC